MNKFYNRYKIRKTRFTTERDRVFRRYNYYNDVKESNWDFFGEPTIFQKIHWGNHSYYNLYIKDRVFDHNMINGLCYGEFRNSVSKIKYTRLYNDRY